MSKEAALRAMREARFNARTQEGAAAPRRAARPTRARAAEPGAPASPTEAPSGDAPSGDALCGHRSMNGRTCTREQGHAAKSHRYS
jgi:hypothetical protein